MTTSSPTRRSGRWGQTRVPSRPNSAPRQFSARFVLGTGALLFAIGMVAGAGILRARRQTQSVVVSINGTNLTRTAFAQRLEADAGPNTLHDMIDEELQLQFAKQKGVVPAEKEVEARFARTAQQSDYRQHLQQTHETPEMVKRRIRVGLAAAAVLAQGMQVSEAEVRQYYQSQIAPNNPNARYYTPATVRTEVIVTPSQAQAQQALNALKAGVPFEEVAHRYSIDASRDAGGQVAPFQRGRNRLAQVPGMEAALFGLKIGDQWGPRRVGNTWWIVRCLDKTPEQTVPYEAVADECGTAALVAKAMPVHGRQVMGEYAEFKRHANLQAFDQTYEGVVNALERP